MKTKRLLVYAIQEYAAFADRLARLGGMERAPLEEEVFPDGEIYHRLTKTVRDRNVVLVGGTLDDRTTLQIYDLACAIVKYGAQSLQLVIPYFGYATMERALREGEVVKAKTRARLLSSIPQAALENRILLMDLHAEGIPYYFEGNVSTIHVYAEEAILRAIRGMGYRKYVLGATDAGRAKWIQAHANRLGVEPAFVFKRRLTARRTEVVAMSAQVEGRDVVLYDDMIRTGGSLIEAAEAYREAGARRMAVVTTHGVFAGDALARLKRTGLFDCIACTDSHPRARDTRDRWLKVYPVADRFLTYIRRFE